MASPADTTPWFGRPTMTACSVKRNSTCTEVCWDEMVGAFGRHEAWLRDTANEKSRELLELQPWQLAVVAAVTASLVINHGRWAGWILLSLSLLVVQYIYVSWQFVMIALDVVTYQAIKWLTFVLYVWESLHRWGFSGNLRRRWTLRRRLQRATTWAAYREAAAELDTVDDKEAWRSAPSGYPSSGVALAARQLREAREAGDAEDLVALLRTMMQRNHLQIDRTELHTECRVGTKHAIEELVGEQVAALAWLVDAALESAAADDEESGAEGAADEGGGGGGESARTGGSGSGRSSSHGGRRLGLDAILEFFDRSSVCLGHTALCLSGGGALSMYHMGVVKALLEDDAMPSIVSGTSGGAIVACMLGTNTDEEMLSKIIQPDIATRYAERWFPPMEQQLLSYLKHGCLVEHDDFARTCRAYFGDETFGEAFARTQVRAWRARACAPCMSMHACRL